MTTKLSKSEGKFFMPIVKDDYDLGKIKENLDIDKAKNLLLEAAKTKQEEINQKIEKLELLPLGVKVIIQAYPQNPYRKVVQGNIIVEYNGSFLNPESGEKDQLKELVGCAKVIEVGTDCKWLKPGDDIYYDTRSTYPIPFMSLGYLLTTEPQVLCVINEGLKQRFFRM